MRAAGAVVRHAVHQVAELLLAAELRLQHTQSRLQRPMRMQVQDALGQGAGDQRRGQVVDRG
ncbi:hypothetical protein D3C84_686200 [compost metagenome]